MITIVDYGMGNLRSVQKAFEKLGVAAAVTSHPEEVARAEKLVLPGVGAFRDAIAHLRENHLVEPIREVMQRSKPFLGICLGLQLLFERGEEDGIHEGLGVFPGKVVRFEIPLPLKVPHMGWNQLNIVRRPPLLEGVAEGSSVYFVHSYHVVPDNPALAATTTDYGGPFVSMIWHENIVASQFHPEKSQKVGLALLANFAKQ